MAGILWGRQLDQIRALGDGHRLVQWELRRHAAEASAN